VNTATLGLEVSVPPGWMRVLDHDLPVAFAGPVADGWCPMLAFEHEDVDPPTADGLATGTAMLKAEQSVTYPGFELLDEVVCEIDGRAAYIEHFRWFAPLPLTQVMAIIELEPGRALKMDGVCLTSLAEHHLSVLDEIIRSVTL
jgi:hypothetical protein